MRDRELTARTKLAFGVGQVAESIQLNTFDFFLFFYYVQVLHLNPVLAGTATLLALVVDAITDPAVGLLSDNCRSRLGRRHPFMYASAIPFGLMFYLLFSPPAGIADSALFAWLAAFAIATRVSLTFFIVPYFAVGAELTENYRDRTSLVAYRTMFSFASAIALSAVSFSVFFRANAEYAQGQLNPDAYPLFGITFAAVVVCAILASAAGTHRQIPFLHGVSRDKGNPVRFAGLVRELTDLAKNRSFLAIFLMSITFFVVAGISECCLTGLPSQVLDDTSARSSAVFLARSSRSARVSRFRRSSGSVLEDRRLNRQSGKSTERPSTWSTRAPCAE